MTNKPQTFELSSDLLDRHGLKPDFDLVSLKFQIGDVVIEQFQPKHCGLRGVLAAWLDAKIKFGPGAVSKALFDADLELATRAVFHTRYSPDDDGGSARLLGLDLHKISFELMPLGPWFEDVFLGYACCGDEVRLWGGRFVIPEEDPWRPDWTEKFEMVVSATEFWDQFSRVRKRLEFRT